MFDFLSFCYDVLFFVVLLQCFICVEDLDVQNILDQRQQIKL